MRIMSEEMWMAVDAANQEIPGLIRYLRICGYPATGSNEGNLVTDPEVNVGDYTIQILTGGGYCLTRMDADGKIQFWPTRRVKGVVVNDMLKDLKNTGVPYVIERETYIYRLYHAAANEIDAKRVLGAVQIEPGNPVAILIEQKSNDGATYYCVYLQTTSGRGRR